MNINLIIYLKLIITGKVLFITDNMDVAIKAGFTFHMGEDREKEYLETLSEEEVEVPKDKLDNLRK